MTLANALITGARIFQKVKAHMGWDDEKTKLWLKRRLRLLRKIVIWHCLMSLKPSKNLMAWI